MSSEEREFQQWREQGLDIDVETLKLSIFELKRRIYIQLCGFGELSLFPGNGAGIANMVMIIRGRIAQDDQCIDDWITRMEPGALSVLVIHVVLKDWTDVKKQRGRLVKPSTELTQETHRVSEKHLEGKSVVEEFVSPPISVYNEVPNDELSNVRLPPGYNGPVCFWNGIPYILQQYWDGSSSSLPPTTVPQVVDPSSQTFLVPDTHTTAQPIAPQQPNENNPHPVAAAPVYNRAVNTLAREAQRNHLWIAIRLGFLVYILSQNGGFSRCFFLCCIAFLVYLFQSGRIQLHASWRHPGPQTPHPTLNIRRSTAGTSPSVIRRLIPPSFIYQFMNSRRIQQARMICLSFIGSLIPGSSYENNPRPFRDRGNPDPPRHDPP